MNRVQMAIMRANRQRMEKAMQSHRNQRAVQQTVQRPDSVRRADGVDISMRAIQQDAKQHVKENFNADGSKRQTSVQSQEQNSASNAQNVEHKQGFAERVQNTGKTSGQVQNPVQSKGNSLQSVKAREQQEKRTDRER